MQITSENEPHNDLAYLKELSVWLFRLSLAQATAISWLILAQIAAWNRQGMQALSLEIVISSASLALCLLLSVLSSKLTALLWLSMPGELVLLTIATAFGTVSGFQLLFLLLLGKAALLCEDGRRVVLWFFFCMLAFLVSAVPNQQLFVQSAQGFKQTEGIFSIMFSRELVPWLIGAGIVIAAARSIRAEISIRNQLELLSQRLESLSAEIERNRVATEINASVRKLAAQTIVLVDKALNCKLSTDEIDSEAFARAVIEQARDTANEALDQVRQALKVLRS